MGSNNYYYSSSNIYDFIRSSVVCCHFRMIDSKKTYKKKLETNKKTQYSEH